MQLGLKGVSAKLISILKWVVLVPGENSPGNLPELITAVETGKLNRVKGDSSKYIQEPTYLVYWNLKRQNPLWREPNLEKDCSPF